MESVDATDPPTPTPEPPTATPSITPLPTATPAPTEPQSILTDTANDTTFEIVQAVHENGRLKISMVAYRNGDAYTSWVCWGDNCRLIDTEGNSFNTGIVIVGSSEEDGGRQITFPNRTSFRFEVEFENIPALTQISLLEVPVQGNNVLEFRNIPIPFEQGSAFHNGADLGAVLLDTANDTEFEIVEVSQSADKLVFTLLGRRNGDNYTSWVCWGESCRLFDSQGNGYNTGMVSIGGSMKDGGRQIEFPDRAAFKFEVTFEFVPALTTISLLEIPVQGGNLLEFRHVPVPLNSESTLLSNVQFVEPILLDNANDTEFEIIDIVRSDRSIDFTVLANRDGDAYTSWVCWGESCRLTDTQGNSYQTGVVIVDDSEARGGTQVSIPSRASFTFVISFENIPDLAEIRLFEVPVQGGHILKFRNLIIPR